MMPKVLIVDDDRSVLRLAAHALSEAHVEVLTATNAEDGLDQLRTERPDVVLLDIMLPGISGIEFARQIRDHDPRLPVVFISISDDSNTAIEAMTLGAFEYIVKPIAVEQVRNVIMRALETRRRMQSPVHLLENGASSDDGDMLVGRSPEMLDVYKHIGRVAARDVSVIIRGESGTGKELIARAIYQHSLRKGMCFLAVNCAALTDTLLESELFGHEKGAFTGADRRHIGKFEQCNGGTIFLDEIGDMSPQTQSKVLRLLQEQQFERVGGKESISVDVRVISATHCDLDQMIEEGSFRLDLYHRLNAFEIHLPPLRERGDDIRLLVEHFLARLNSTLGKSVSGIDPSAMDILMAYHWPGNIRELQSVLQKALLMSVGPVLVPEYFPAEVLQNHPYPHSNKNSQRNGETTDLAEFLDAREAGRSCDLYNESVAWMERYLLQRVLQDVNGNQSQAAKRLGITRGSLRFKLRANGISIDQVVKAEEKVGTGID